MRAIRHSTILVLILGIVLLGGSAACQGIYLDHVDGLDPEGGIPEGATLTFHMRVVGDATVHKMLNNGFTFSSDGFTWGGVAGEFNPAYPWDDWFDFVKKFNYWCDGSGEDTVGLGLLSLFGPGLPIGFDDIAFSFTIGPVTGSAGDVLILDSSWYPPTNPWMWDIVDRDVAWGGPYAFGSGASCSSPRILSVPNTQAGVGVLYNYDVQASGYPAPSYLLPIHPIGMTIDSATGLIQWTPDENQLGDHTVTVAAYNECGNPAFQPFTVNVVEELPCQPVAITSTPPLNAMEGIVYTYEVEATGYPSPTFLLPVYPEGMIIDPVTGFIEWTPTEDQVGEHAVTVAAANDCGNPAFQPFIVNVEPGPGCDPPQFDSEPVTEAIVGWPYTYHANAGEYTDVTYSLIGAPEGMTIGRWTGIISWIPPEIGDFVVVAKATSVDCLPPIEATQTFTIHVSCGTPWFESVPVIEAYVGWPYTYDVNAHGYYEYMIYSLTQAPVGMTIEPTTGLIEWLPPDIGDFPITVTVTHTCDGVAYEETQAFTVCVVVPPEPYIYYTPQWLSYKDLPDILEIHLIWEKPEDVVWESIRIQERMSPANGYPIVRDGHLVAGCDMMQFLGVSGWRPVTQEIVDYYTFAYDKTDGNHVVLSDRFYMCIYCGASSSDAPFSLDDVVLMIDYLWRGGDTGEFYEEEINAIMDVDGNGRVDAVDIVRLIQQSGY